MLNGKFVLSQLPVMTDQGKAAKGVSFQESPCAVALSAEVAKGPIVTAGIMSNGIRIMDVRHSNAASLLNLHLFIVL